MGVPYFLSAQLDGQARQGGKPSGFEVFEGGVGLALNVAVWVTAFILELHLSIYELNVDGTNSSTLQRAAMVTLAIAAGTIMLFTLIGICNDHSFSSTVDDDAKFLPPFASSLISGNLKSSTVFSILLILSQVLLAPGTEANNFVLELLVAQVSLKLFGTSLAMNNQRLKGYAQTETVFAVA